MVTRTAPLRGHRHALEGPGFLARADLQVLDLSAARQLPYHFGVSHVRAVFRAGRQVLGAPLD